MAFFLGCREDSDKYHKPVFATADSIKPPVIIKAGEFEVLPLNTLPQPEVFPLSQSPQPSVTNAGFYVSMENFNTEHGLALSSLICSYKDKAGNIWFGTSGNGVSIYNGETFINLSSGHGLIHNFITSITQDSKGNFWFGTYGGISKYNGVTFENFTIQNGLPDVTIREILEDRNGTIWIASAGGVSIYQPSQNGTSDELFINYDKEDGLIGGSVLAILEDRMGNLWFAGAGGVSKYTGDTPGKKAFSSYSEAMGVTNQIVNTINEDDAGNIWLGTREFLVRYDPVKQTYTRFTSANGLANNYIISSTKDSRGDLWFGTKGGVSKYSKKDRLFLNFTTEHGLADNQIQSITEDDAGSLWFGTYGGGISKYDGEGVFEFSNDQGLPGKAIYAITEDSNENLWFAPLYGGLVQFRRNGKEKMGGTYINYTEEHGLANNTIYNSIEDSKGNLWFGTATGLSMFDGEKFYKYTIEQGLPDNYITALFVDSKDDLWIGTYNNGVSKFDGDTLTNFSTEHGLVHKTVWNFFEDNEGILWIATRGGLSRFDGSHFMNFTTEQGLPDNKLSTVIQDAKGNIITAGWGGGVSFIRHKNVDRLSVKESQNYTTNIFEHFSTAEGLANDVVYNILEDRDGNLIIGSSFGLTFLKGGISDSDEKIAADSIENYNEKTGYPIKDISHIYSMYADSRGFIWAGTGDKLVRFDYSKTMKSQKAPSLSLQDIKINYQRISWNTLDWARSGGLSQPDSRSAIMPPYATEERLKFGRLLTSSERDSMIQKFRNISFNGITPFNSIPENLILPYNINNISFDFIGVETSRPHLVRYRHKLEGNDENWSPSTNKTTASFGNIFEGDYTFMVQAQSPQGIWSEPLMYSFTILPPWYRSGAALFFYILIFFGGVYSVHRFQKARTIRNEREKTQQRELEQAKKIKEAYQELEVEAALERVRSTSVAMRSTSELQEVVNTVAQQMLKINININGGVFIVINEEVDPDVPIWGSGGAADYVNKAVVPYLDRPIFKCLRDAIIEEKDFLVEIYSKEEKVEFFEHLFKHQPWNSVPAKKKRKLLSLPGGYTRSMAISSLTSIFIINNTGKIFSDEENDILRRFARVFEQSYIRFLDLQIAEKQAREELRQASLDRVRGEIASMRSTEDLQQIIPVIWRELTVLDIPFFRCGILIFDESHSTIKVYLSGSDGRLLAIFNLPYQANPFTVNVVEHWKNGMIYKEHWDGEDFTKWAQSMTSQGQIRDEKEYPGSEEIPESLDLHLIPFKQGMLYIGNDESLTTEEIDLAKSLAEAFSIAYARYDDFNKLEQAKEKVEEALVELKAVQQQLVQQEKLASLGQLTAGIAHEIKNPLNFVTNFSDVSIELIQDIRKQIKEKKTELLLDESGPDSKSSKNKKRYQGIPEMLENIEKNLHIIHDHGRRADAIIKSMLQQSGGNGNAEPTDLNNLIREFVNFAFHGMRSDKNPIDVQITLNLDESIEEIPLRGQDFSRVVTNLCNNAFDAMKEKRSSGSVDPLEYKPELTVRTRCNNKYVIMEIEDNGPGISQDIMDKILQPFFTTKKGTEGTGLGLYITNDIVKAHGGILEIVSDLGEFSRFVVKIPYK